MLLFPMKVRFCVLTLAANLRILGPTLSITVDLFRSNMEGKLFTKTSFVGEIRNSVSGIFDFNVFI